MKAFWIMLDLALLLILAYVAYAGGAWLYQAMR
jgi:hypothetical protein